MRQAESKVEPKTEPFDDGDKVANGGNNGNSGGGGGQQQSTQNQLQSQVATSQAPTNASFVDTNGNSEGNEILVLVPALNANGLTTANITTEYRTVNDSNGRNLLERKAATTTNASTTNDLQNYTVTTRSNSNANVVDNTINRNSIVTEQIVWIPKIEQQQEHGQHQATTVGNVCQPPLYSRIKQLNYSQVEI